MLAQYGYLAFVLMFSLTCFMPQCWVISSGLNVCCDYHYFRNHIQVHWNWHWNIFPHGTLKMSQKIFMSI